MTATSCSKLSISTESRDYSDYSPDNWSGNWLYCPGITLDEPPYSVSYNIMTSDCHVYGVQ